MNEERARHREPTTADIAAAAEERADQIRDRGDVDEREVTLREGPGPVDDYNEDNMRLLPDDVINELRPRWSDIQASFVDAPRRSVEQADALVADAIRRLAEKFADARANLERDWDRGEEVSTGPSTRAASLPHVLRQVTAHLTGTQGRAGSGGNWATLCDSRSICSARRFAQAGRRSAPIPNDAVPIRKKPPRSETAFPRSAAPEATLAMATARETPTKPSPIISSVRD